MKLLLITFTIIMSCIAHSQNLKTIIKNNDIVAVKKYINENEILDELITFEGHFKPVHPMIYASKLGKVEIVKIFVANKGKIEDYFDIMSVAFISSLAQNNNNLTDYLYSLSPNINGICNLCHDHNAIMVATVYGKEDWYFKLKPKSTLNAVNNEGDNLLHLSALSVQFNQNIFEDILTLIEVDISLENKYNYTPLQSFAQQGNLKSFNKLIAIKAKYHSLENLYLDAIFGKNIDIYNYVSTILTIKPYWKTLPPPRSDEKNTLYPLELAIRKNNLAIVKLILEDMLKQVRTEQNDSKTEILVNILNSRKMEKDTFWPLWTSTEYKNKAMFKYLLKKSIGFNDLQLDYTYFDDLMDTEYTGKAEVLFKKYDYRSAKKIFGKTYTKNIYKELNIEF